MDIVTVNIMQMDWEKASGLVSLEIAVPSSSDILITTALLFWSIILFYL